MNQFLFFLDLTKKGVSMRIIDKKAMMIFLGAGIFLVLLSACESSGFSDVQPPKLISTEKDSEGNMLFSFDENLSQTRVSFDGIEGGFSFSFEDNRMKLSLPEDLSPGSLYYYRVYVWDKNNNMLHFSGSFYAKNTQPAEICLNEVRIAGSDNKMDFVEFFVIKSGHLGGLTLECYDSSRRSQVKIFPDVILPVGAYVVLHCKSLESTLEIDETQESAQSTRSEAKSTAWDYWLEGGKGLSGTTGLLILRDTPDGQIKDMLSWSTKKGASLAMLQDQEIPGLWEGEELSPVGCTSTRTWCRKTVPAGWGTSVSSEDWMIVNTGQSTIGEANNLIPWQQPSNKR